MDIDSDVSCWILEFLLKQPLEDTTLNSLIRTLPLPNDNPSLKKSLLLKKLESQITHKSSVSEKTLVYLEKLEELEFQRGVEKVSDAMKCAYWQVAVECSAKYFEEEIWEEMKYDLCKSPGSVWWKVDKMEKVEKGGLGSEELFTWQDDLQNALWDRKIYKKLVKKSKGINAIEAIRVYLKEEREKMGPSFLEVVARTFKDEDTVKKVLGSNVPKELALQNADPVNGEVQKDSSSSHSHGTVRGAEISDSDCLTVKPLYSVHDLPPSPEVDRVQEALEASRVDLQASVNDPLPDALRQAEEITANARGSTNGGPMLENHVSSNPSAGNGPVAVTNGGNPSNRVRPSLMERNETAHTHEWEDSIENSMEDSADRGGRPKLPTPKKSRASPLKIWETKQVKTTRRRGGGRWTPEEEDILREGVNKYGAGRWKDILNAYHVVFEGRRTQTDLKDKWRNLMKY